MTKQSDSLRTLRRAIAARESAERAYRVALLEHADALEAAGVHNVYAVLATELGCSRQSARERVKRARGDW